MQGETRIERTRFYLAHIRHTVFRVFPLFLRWSEAKPCSVLICLSKDPVSGLVAAGLVLFARFSPCVLDRQYQGKEAKAATCSNARGAPKRTILSCATAKTRFFSFCAGRVFPVYLETGTPPTCAHEGRTWKHDGTSTYGTAQLCYTGTFVPPWDGGSRWGPGTAAAVIGNGGVASTATRAPAGVSRKNKPPPVVGLQKT